MTREVAGLVVVAVGPMKVASCAARWWETPHGRGQRGGCMSLAEDRFKGGGFGGGRATGAR